MLIPERGPAYRTPGLESSQSNVIWGMASHPLSYVPYEELGGRDNVVVDGPSYQGTAVLTQALREPALMVDEGRRLERWVDSLEPSDGTR